MNSVIVTLNCICCTHKGVHTVPIDHNYVQCPPVKYNTYSWGMPTVPVNNNQSLKNDRISAICALNLNYSN